ncbi:MAG: MarR family transcriptional regulator [Chloroflexi bacterium]|nr:MarR family transcriptional regulator [Chloroflexota bacterium]
MALPENESSQYKEFVPFGDKYYNLWMLVHLTHSALLRARHHEIRREVGITYMEFAALSVVDTLGTTATPAKISRWLMRKPQSVSDLLTRMEKRGLLKREPHPSSKKLKMVVVLPKGREALNLAKSIDSVPDIMCCVSEDEFRQLWLLLQRLRARALARLA